MAEKKTVLPPDEMSQQYVDEMVALRRAQEQTRIFKEKKNRGPLTPSYFSTQNPIGQALGLRGDYEPNTAGQIMGGIIGALAPFSMETDYEKQEDGLYDRTYKNVKLDTPQFIKDMANRVTDQMTGAKMGYVEPLKALETTADFVGSGILFSTPARQAARDAGQTILGTSGGRIEPSFGIGGNQPPTSDFRVNMMNDTANPPIDFAGPYGVNPPVKKHGFNVADDVYFPAQTALGKMSFAQDPGKPSLTGATLLNQFKRFGVTQEELGFLGLDTFLKGNPNRKFSYDQINKWIDANSPDITRNFRTARDGNVMHGNTQRLVGASLQDNQAGGYFELDFIDLDATGGRNPNKRGNTEMALHHSPEKGTIGHVRGTDVFTNLIFPGAGGKTRIFEENQFDLTQYGQQKRGRPESHLSSKGMEYGTFENIQALRNQVDMVTNHPGYQRITELKDTLSFHKNELAQNQAAFDQVVVAETAFRPDSKVSRGDMSDIFIDAADAPTITVQDYGAPLTNNANQIDPSANISRMPTDPSNKRTTQVSVVDRIGLQDSLTRAGVQKVTIMNKIDELKQSIPEGTPFPDAARRQMNVLRAKLKMADEEFNNLQQYMNAAENLNSKFGDITDAYQTATSLDPGNARADRRIARRGASSAFSLDDQGQPLTGEALAAYEAKYVDFPRLQDISTDEFSVEALMEMGFDNKVASALSPELQGHLTSMKNGINVAANQTQIQDKIFKAEEALDKRNLKPLFGKFVDDGGVTRMQVQMPDGGKVNINPDLFDYIIRGETLADVEARFLAQNPPHKKNTTAAKFGYRMGIRDGLERGVDTFIFPNSRDVASLRTVRESTAFDDTYDAVPKQIIKEYKDMGYDVEVGVLSPGQMDGVARDPMTGGSFQRPLRYIRFRNPEQLDGTSVRMYNKGGYINTGILSVTRKAS